MFSKTMAPAIFVLGGTASSVLGVLHQYTARQYFLFVNKTLSMYSTCELFSKKYVTEIYKVGKFSREFKQIFGIRTFKYCTHVSTLPLSLIFTTL